MTIGLPGARRPNRSRRTRIQRSLKTYLVERLEERRLLAVASMPDQPLAAMPDAIAVESGLIDNNASLDLVALGSQGQLAVALNGGDNAWQSVQTHDLPLGPAYGLASGLLSADASLDLVAVGADKARILLGDRTGGFTLGPQLAAPSGASWRPTDDGLAGVAIGYLNDDLQADIVLLDTAQQRVFVWWGGSDGSFSTSTSFPSGGSDPISLAIGDVVGDMRTDIVVGHRDGTISLLEGTGDGNFTLDATSSQLHRAGPIRSLAIADLDGDGLQDIAVSATTEAFVLRRDAHRLAGPPILNGDFTRGLTGWRVETAGEPPGQQPGEVNAVSGSVELDEHHSFLTSLSQSFAIPPAPQTISIDLKALGLEYADGAIPDAFELSLLDSDGNSLVATHRAGATSFFNAVGTSSGTPEIHLATGVAFDGYRITLDISGLTAGTEATLFVDLIGHPPGEGASATIDNVSISPAAIFSHSFTFEQLPGALALSGGMRIGDVDGDAFADIIVADRGADQIVVFNGSGDGSFTRSVLDAAAFGSQPTGIALSKLDGDSIADIAYTLADPGLIVTPLNSAAQATGGRCLPAIDFETDANGNPLAEGSVFADQFAAWGMHVSTDAGSAVQPRVVDWSGVGDSASGGASEQGKVVILALPGEERGEGGDEEFEHEHEHEHEYEWWGRRGIYSSSGSSVEDRQDEDWDADHDHDDDHDDDRDDDRDDDHDDRDGDEHDDDDEHDDHEHDHEEHDEDHDEHDQDDDEDDGQEHHQGGWVAAAGTLVFSFDSPVMLDGIGLLGIVEGDRASVRAYSAGGSLIQSIDVAGSYRGTRQAIELDALNVARVEVTFAGSGAISDIDFCRDLCAGSQVAIEGSSDNIAEGQTVQLQLSSPQVTASEWLINWGDGTLETLPGDPASATHRYSDGPAERHIFATARDAAGNVYLANGWHVAVADVAPELSITGPAEVEARALYRLDLSAIDLGDDSLSGWTINWGDGAVDSLPGDATSAQHVYRPRYAKPTRYKIQATARDEDNASGSPYRSNTLSISVIPDTSLRLPTIDFERSAAGARLRPGDRISDQFAALGLSVSTLSATQSPMILVAGQGTDDEHDRAKNDCWPIGNALAIADENGSLSLDGDATSGTLVFNFEKPVRLDEVQLFGIADEGSSIRLFAADGTAISSVSVPNRGSKSLQVVALNASHVSRMEIALASGGAVATIVSCRDNPPIPIPESRYFVIDGGNRIFRYSAQGFDIGDFVVAAGMNARGIAADRDANLLWIVSEEGNQDRVYVYDTARERLLGSWKPQGVVAPQGIATDGNDIWILDGSSNRVLRYASAAHRRSGAMAAKNSFALSIDNREPNDLVTDGSSLWVVDGGSDKVYAYQRDGSLLNQWALDPVNSDPVGIAINPSSDDGIYVVDATSQRVYSYSHRTLPVSGSQLAADSFALASGNASPLGLADPSEQIVFGMHYSDTLTSGQVVDWPFSATAGQKIYVHFETLGDWMQSDLIAPDGHVIYSKISNRPWGLDSGSLTLPATGNYRLRLTATATSTPTYAFRVFDIPPPDVHEITFGQVEEGALESPGRADQWTFTAASGTRLYLDFLTLQTVVGGDLVVDVVAPSGAIISTRTATLVNSLDQGFTLLESGQYTLVMHAAFDGAQTPSYSFQLWQVPPDDVGQLSYRQSVSGTIEVPGARDRWTFDATAGQNVFVDFVRITGGDLRVQVVQPDGATLASRTFSLPAGLDQELVLPQSGTYTVIVDGAGTANLNTYEFTLWDIPPEVVEQTTLNTTLSGYAVPGQTVPFEFQAQAGTPILLDMIETSNQALGVTIIQPDGQTLVTRATKDTLATLPQTGTYRALVARANPSLLDGHGEYAFRIQDASSPERGEPDNRGTRFYVAFPPNLREPFVTYDPTFSLSLTSAVDTSGTVQIPGLGFYTTYEVKAGQATVIALPATVELSDPDKVLDRGILVTALDEVSVYGLDQFQLLTEGFTALPTDAIGKDYYVLGYANTVTYVIGGGTNFTLAATANNTQVTIVPSVAVGAHAAGVPFTITLNQGQAYTLHTSEPLLADLSGTRVTATEPIALMGGNTATRVPSGFNAANHLIEQLPPLEAWGRRFITLPLATRTGGDTFRILAQQDGTEVRIDGQLVATLAAGQFDERILTAGSIIEGSAPLLVAQYSNSSAFDNAQADPFMMLVPPFEQFLNDYVLTTPATGFDTNFANLVVPTSALDSVTLDDQPVPPAAFAPIGASGYSGARLPISVGAHHFHANEPLGVSIYGYAPFDAYGYFGGMSAGSVAAVSSLSLTPGDVALPTGTQHTVTAAVFDRLGRPLRGVRVDFTVEGASAERYFAFTDRDGRASIVYTRTAPGTDTITASAAGQVQTATASWLAAAPTVHLIQPAPGEQVPAGKLLITGIASPGSPSSAIAEVTVNGRRVDTLDAAGNFFAVVDVAVGEQTFVFTATDSLGLEAFTTLALVGVSGTDSNFDVQQSSDVTASTNVQFSGTTFNRKTHHVLADMRLRNAGAEPLDPAIAVQLDRIAPSSVHLVAADSVSDDGHPLMVFDSELPPDGLASGQASAPIAIALDDAALDRFALELSVLARNNRPPRFVTSPGLEIAAGSTYRYAASAIDPDSSRITYALTSAPAEMQIEADSGVITCPVVADAIGSHQISITASDGRGGVATQTFTLSVLSSLPNRPPVFQSAPNTGVLPGADYRYAAQASDADNDSIVFSLAEGPSGMTVDAASGLVSYDNAASGVYSVALTASDTRGGTATQRFTLQVGPSSGIGSPTILSTPPVTAVAGGQYVYTVWAVDPMQTQLEFSLLEAPAGMTIDSASGRITWQPTSSDVGTEPSVRIEVRNALGGIGSQAYRVAVLAVRPGAAPAFESKPLALTTVDEAYRYTAQAIDPDGQPLVYGLVTAPAGMAIDSSTGEITWTASASDRGPHRILVTATDPEGLVAYQAYALSVRGLNTPPEFVSSPKLTTTLGNAYRYNARASDAEDEVTYALVDAPGGMLVDARGGAVTWRPSLSDVGNHPITVRATDARGLAAEQTFELTVAADSEAPAIEIAVSQASVDVGQSVTVRVSASDNVAVTSLLLYANGQPLALDPSGEATFTATASGFQQFVATAADASSNTASARGLLRVRDASDTIPPVVSIQSPSSNAVLTYLTDIVGSVTDANLEKVVLEYSRLGMDNWHTIAARSILDGGPIAVVADRIGTFDPTLLLNDQYEIRLTGTDLGGLSASTSIVVNLEGNAKIGTLEIPSAEECQTCSAGDVTIPVAGGPPIAITRQYSTLTADQSGDFGQGWQFCMAEPNLRETPARSEFEDIMGQFAALPFREGQKVYITTPTCERVGFTFSPTLHTGVWSEVGSAFYDPRWVPDPGVDWQLYGENDYTRLTGIASGEFDLNGLPLPLVQYEGDQYILAGLSASYSPLGYQLISKDGTRYHYSQSEGLLDVTDRHGNQLSMTADGITSSSGQAVQFQRDSQGRITKIIDGEGRETSYTYNADGELVKVEYPSGLSNTYRYTADHLLAGINEGANPSEQEMLTRSFQYDAAGRLAATLDAFGYSNTQTYDLATRTQTNFDALGNATMYQYDARGNIVWERSPTGATITMEYDADDNRTRIVDEMGFATSFTYDAHGNTTSVTDALGNTTSFAYDKGNSVVYQRDARGGEYFYYYSDDGDGRGKDIIRAVQPGGGDSQLTYDSSGRLLSVTDVDGRVRRYEYGNQPYPVRITERDGSSVQIEYNAHGHMQAYIDELGRRTTYTYDAQERPVSITDPLGQVTHIAYQGRGIERVVDALGNETRYVLDAEFRPLQIIQPDGGVTVLEYDPNGRRTAMVDPNGNRTRYTYRVDGRLETETDPQGGVTTYEYDAVGHQIAVTNPGGHRWQTEYDALGYVVATVDPLGGRTEQTYDAMGNLTSQTDALGRTTSFEYNNVQRPTRIIDALGGETSLAYAWDGRLLSEQDALGRVRTYTYDAVNRLTSKAAPLGGTQQFVYDAAGNQIESTDERGSKTQVEYDALNRPVRVIDASGASSQIAYDALGHLVGVTDASGAVSSIEYDAVGRPVATTDPLGGVQRVTYDLAGNLVSSVDVLGRETTYTYDSLNRQMSKTDPLGGVTHRSYDAVGNLLSVRDPLGNVTTFTYDALERYVGSTDPLGAEASRRYDAVGNVVETVDRNGLKTEFSYDALDRVLGEQWLSDTGDAVNTVSYGYDASGNLLFAGDAYSHYALSYDALNRLATVDNRGTPQAPQVTLIAGYDAASNRTSLADDSGVTVSSTYDARNLLLSRTWSGGEVAAARAEFGYASRGLLASVTRYASLDASTAIGSSAYRYDAEGRLENIEHFGAAGEALVEYAYVRDLANQLTSETHHGHSYSYTRDALGQLTGAAIDDVPRETYAYDAHGNRTNSGEVIGAGNRLLENATSRFEYDGEGNLVRRIDKATGDVTEYAYDHRQRLVSGTRRSATGALLSSVVNTYDVFNRRIARTVDVDGAGPLPATTMHTVYDGDHAWADYDDSGRAVARYLFGDGIDDIMARWRPSEGVAWYLTDHLGTVRDIVDAAGTVIDTLEYDSFGQIISQSNAAAGDRFTFTGREWDPQLNLYYYRARFYDPAAGRFISQDPLGFGAGDSNLYRYVGNSPLDFTDPSGLLALTECAFVRAVDTTINIACTVQKMSLDGSLASQDIDRQVENAFQLMNTAFDVLPFGSSMALKTTMRAITMVQTAQALASLAVNDNLFNLLEVAETYVVEAARMYEQGAAATFQEALHAFAQSDNKQLLLTKMVCGAANMGLMVLSAKSRCFVAGTPVVVSLLPPEELAAQQAADQFGITMFDVLAGVALGGVIAARLRFRREEDDPAMQQQARDSFFEGFDRDADEQDEASIELWVAPQAGSSEPTMMDDPVRAILFALENKL